MTSILYVVAGLSLTYTIAIQLYMLLLAIGSIPTLRRTRHISSQLEAMRSSDMTPPVSIIVPAFNEAIGIIDAIRSMATLEYPRFEIVVVNDGSTDDTLDVLRKRFKLDRLTIPYRHEIPTAAVRSVFRTEMPLSLTVVDKENSGRADALNAGINVAQYPYVLLTDADMIFDKECLLRSMRHVVMDRANTVAVGGNIRPLNGCTIKHGRVQTPRIPKRFLERMQVVEYIRSFVAARPALSRINGLPLISGAFGLYRRDVVAAVGGLTRGHFGEDLDLTMRVHRYLRDGGIPYRMVYASDAVSWTEVPMTREVLRTQRRRWHYGLMRAVSDFSPMLFRPKYGPIGMIGWPAFFLFEYLAPIIEAVGIVILPIVIIQDPSRLGPLASLTIISFSVGIINTLTALGLDSIFGYFTKPTETLRLLGFVFVENLGPRQLTLLWRIQALVSRKETRTWGDMKRQGVTNLA